MRRVICIYLPEWTIEARRKRTPSSDAPDKPTDRPFGIVGQDGQQQVVRAANPAATQHGITPGMPLTHARAIVPTLLTAPDQPMEDMQALQRLALGCLRFSPWVACAAADSLWLDATGVAHLFGGEPRMLHKIVRVLARSGLTARAAMANTPGAAWAWARYGRTPIVISARADELNPLPILALRVSPQAAHGLWRVGVKTIGDLRVLPRATLPVRFGKEVLMRLDQALGHAPETINPIFPPEARRRDCVFAEPISTRDSLDWITTSLTRQLCEDLEKAQEGARKLDLVFRRTDNSHQVIRIGMRKATRDAAHVFKLLAAHFESVDPGFGIEAATLTAWRVEPLFPVQTATDGSAADNAKDMAELVDTLSHRAEAKQVYRMAPVATHVPEWAAKQVDPMTVMTEAWPANLPRPMRMFTPPEPVQAMAEVPDYPPLWFIWRGQRRTVKHADGPERIHHEWWHSKAEVRQTRDYFRVEDEDGGRYWLFRDHRQNTAGAFDWFIHGVFA